MTKYFITLIFYCLCYFGKTQDSLSMRKNNITVGVKTNQFFFQKNFRYYSLGNTDFSLYIQKKEFGFYGGYSSYFNYPVTSNISKKLEGFNAGLFFVLKRFKNSSSINLNLNNVHFKHSELGLEHSDNYLSIFPSYEFSFLERFSIEPGVSVTWLNHQYRYKNQPEILYSENPLAINGVIRLSIKILR